MHSCSFCGRSRDQVPWLVAGATIAICSPCVTDAAAAYGHVVVPSTAMPEVDVALGAELDMLDRLIAAAVAARQPLSDWRDQRAAGAGVTTAV